MRLVKDYIGDLPGLVIERDDYYTLEGNDVVSINGKYVEELFPGAKVICTFDDDYQYPETE